MNEKIFTENAPAAVGPYSQAIKTGNMLFCSGMLPVDPKTGDLVESDVTVQSKQIMKNIDALLNAAGYCADDVVKTTCFLSDIADFAAFNAVYAEYFTGSPARSCFAVKQLPGGAVVEIEAIAEVK